MGNLGGSEILVILFVALIVLGPDKLPEAARQIGNVVRQFKRISGDFRAEFESALLDEGVELPDGNDAAIERAARAKGTALVASEQAAKAADNEAATDDDPAPDNASDNDPDSDNDPVSDNDPASDPGRSDGDAEAMVNSVADRPAQISSAAPRPQDARSPESEALEPADDDTDVGGPRPRPSTASMAYRPEPSSYPKVEGVDPPATDAEPAAPSDNE